MRKALGAFGSPKERIINVSLVKTWEDGHGVDVLVPAAAYGDAYTDQRGKIMST